MSATVQWCLQRAAHPSWCLGGRFPSVFWHRTRRHEGRGIRHARAAVRISGIDLGTSLDDWSEWPPRRRRPRLGGRRRSRPPAVGMALRAREPNWRRARVPSSSATARPLHSAAAQRCAICAPRVASSDGVDLCRARWHALCACAIAIAAGCRAALGGATSTCTTSTSGRKEVSMPERTASVFVQRTIACSTSASSSSAATPKPSWNSSMNWDALYSFLSRPSRQRYAATICLLRS